MGSRLRVAGILFLAGTLLFASAAKAASVAHLHDALYASGLIPLPLATPVAVALIAAEMLTAVDLLASLAVSAWRILALRATVPIYYYTCGAAFWITGRSGAWAASSVLKGLRGEPSTGTTS